MCNKLKEKTSVSKSISRDFILSKKTAVLSGIDGQIIVIVIYYFINRYAQYVRRMLSFDTVGRLYPAVCIVTVVCSLFR